MIREEALKVLEIAATLAAGSISEEQKGGGAAIASAFRAYVGVVQEEFEKLTSSKS